MRVEFEYAFKNLFLRDSHHGLLRVIQFRAKCLLAEYHRTPMFEVDGEDRG